MTIGLALAGGLVHAAGLSYLAAFGAAVLERPKLRALLHACGFGLALAAFAAFWAQMGHPPIHNLFGVFLSLAVLSYPLSEFCTRLVGVSRWAGDPLIGAILLVPVAFVLKPEFGHPPPALRTALLPVHVGAYMLAYVILLKAGAMSAASLWRRSDGDGERLAVRDRDTYRLIRLGFPLLTLGLVLGAVWGKVTWGDYWQWDPKELWSLVMWLVYVGYFQTRGLTGGSRPRTQAAIALAGAVVVVATLLWVNLARIFAGLHSYAT